MPSRRPLLGAIGKHVVFFDGVDDYVNVPDNDSLKPQYASWGALFKLDVLPSVKGGLEQIVHKEFTIDLTAYIDNSIRIGVYAGGSWYSFFTPPNYLKAGTWYFVMATYDGSTIKLYVNNQLVINQSAPYGVLGSSTYLLTVGKHSAIAKNYFLGEIAYVLIYNRALSDEEIQQIYKALKNWEQNIPVTDGLVLGLTPHSIDCENGIWNDISGNNNNAILYGARCLWI